jgi:apolipoprotein N-acyltransferase
MTASGEMTMRTVAYAPPWRAAAGALVALSWAGALGLIVALLFLETRLDNQLRLLRTFVLACAAPRLSAWLLDRAFAASVAITDGLLVLRRRGQLVTVPCDAIDRVEPWSIPLPGAGVSLRLRSGQRFAYGLQVADPLALVDAIATAGAHVDVRAAAKHPAVLHARSRHAAAHRWYHPLLTFVVYALVPTIPLFRLHQWVAYGGTFGEYYIYGLQAYLLGFAAYWWTYTIYLVLYAALLRVIAEGAVLASAWLVPDRVAAVRRIVERLRVALYFAAVPAFLIRIAIAH